MNRDKFEEAARLDREIGSLKLMVRKYEDWLHALEQGSLEVRIGGFGIDFYDRSLVQSLKIPVQRVLEERKKEMEEEVILLGERFERL